MVGGMVEGRTKPVAGKVESLGYPDKLAGLKTGAYNGGIYTAVVVKMKRRRWWRRLFVSMREVDACSLMSPRRLRTGTASRIA